MIRYCKNTRYSIYYTLAKIFICMFLFLSVFEVLSVRAAEVPETENPTPDTPPKTEISILNSKISVGTSLDYTAPIIITYYDCYGTRIAQKKSEKPKQGDTHTITISEFYDPMTGENYAEYEITAYNATAKSMKLSLKGVSSGPELSHKLTEIIIKKAPNKTSYSDGESFDRSGMVVSAFYSDNRWRNISNYTVSPEKLSVGMDSVKITFSEGTGKDKITKTTTQRITVHSGSDSYIITANAAAGGSISDSGNHSVNRGNSKTYTISPSGGHRINYVEVDGNNVGAVSSYTFHNVHENHSINAYFVAGSFESNKKLTVIGSFAVTNASGSYQPSAKISIDAGFVPGFSFAGWTSSDGSLYSQPTISYIMPSYDVILYANWIPSNLSNTQHLIKTTNLKEPQLFGWTDIANKLAFFNSEDLAQPGSPVLNVAVEGMQCYIDATPIAMLNTRQGIALEVSFGTDASFVFYSDVDNSHFTGTDLSYTCTTGTDLFFHEKKIVFAQPGGINTNICISLSLPEAQPGQLAYVYLVDENDSEIIYLPAVVDTNKKISIPINTKINLSVKY